MLMEPGGELKKVISAVSRDKNLEKDVIVDALEQALIQAARKEHGPLADLEAKYNEDADEIELFQFRTVVEDDDVANEDTEIALLDALKLDPESVLGDSIGVKVNTVGFGRIAAQSAKQIIVQKVRDAERAKIYDEFKDRVGEILSGHVRRIERNNIIIDLGRTEAIIPYREQVPTEKFRAKDRLQGFVLEVKRSSRGPQIIMSRAHPGFLVALFEQHVTEIYDGIVSIESAARDPGFRSKIAVTTKDPSIDPVGACVGMKGQRVQAVVQELNGEKIDIIQFDSDPARMVCNALQPAVVSKVIVDEENHAMEIIVAEDQLSLAIGKRGQNVRLAAQLTGWRLDIKSEAKLEAEMSHIKDLIAMIEGVGQFKASILVNEGVTKPEDVVELGSRTLMRLLNLSEEEAEQIAENAKNMDPNVFATVASERDELLANASATPDRIDTAKSEEETNKLDEYIKIFMKVPGLGEVAAHALADGGYKAIGDVIADNVDEVAMRTGLDIGHARSVQIALDRHIQSLRQGRDDN
jgi:transcription termination/antitermination protein NusA